MSTLFTVIRHGETVANLNCVIQGQSDVPLSPAGEKQAELLARRWKNRRKRGKARSRRRKRKASCRR